MLRTSTLEDIPSHFGRRNNVTFAQLLNSSDEGPCAFCLKTFHQYVKPGMWLAGSNAGGD